MYIEKPVIILFHFNQGQLIGRPLLYPYGAEKAAFVDRSYRGTRPENGEAWHCDLISDSDADSRERRGRLIVRPIAKLGGEDAAAFRNLPHLREREGREIRLGGWCQLLLAAYPSHLRTFQQAAATLSVKTLSKNPHDNTVLQVRTGAAIGNPLIVETPEIGPDSVTTFARISGFRHPVRVLLGRDIDCYVTSFAVKRLQGRLLIAKYAFGMLPKTEPCLADAKHFDQSLAYWCRHAWTYKPEGMSRPFDSTWNEVIDDLREQRKPQRPNELLLDGPLIVH